MTAVFQTSMITRRVLAVVAALALLLWSVAPSSSHVPDVIETLADHAEMIETHGHSHGLGDDLAWAIHGHSHDKADHEHMSAVLMPAPGGGMIAMAPAEWHGTAAAHWSPPTYRLKRPPRV